MQLSIEYLLKMQAQLGGAETYDYAALIVDGANWDQGGFHLTVEHDAQLQGQLGTITGFPENAPYVRNHMYSENITLSPYNPTYINTPSSFEGGASGSPIYVQVAADYYGLGVFSYSTGLQIPLTEIYFSFFTYSTRVTDAIVANTQRWSIPLSPDDRICQFQLVIQTGIEKTGGLISQAGTDDPVTLKLDQHDYMLHSYWMPLSGSPSQENEKGHIDGYDLTSALQQNYAGGPFLRDLLAKPYEISKIPDPAAWDRDDWYVASVAFFVNGQLLCYDTFNRWVFDTPGQWNTLNGTLRM